MKLMNPIFTILFLALLLAFGCNNSGSSDSFASQGEGFQVVGAPSPSPFNPPATGQPLSIVPPGTAILSGVVHSFSVQISGVAGTGSFAAGNITTASSGTVTGLPISISFSNLASINPATGTFRATGLFSAALSGSGTVSTLIIYSEGEDTSVGATFTFTVGTTGGGGGGSATITFSPASPGTFTVGGTALNVTLTGSPSGGVFSIVSSSTTTTGGSFTLSGSSLSFSGATTAGTATTTILYVAPDTSTTTSTYSVTVISNPADPLIITGVVDGPLTGGVPKAIELFVGQSIADLSAFGLEAATNGGAATGVEFTFPAISVTAGEYLYVATTSGDFSTFFGFAPDFVNGVASINGNDTIILYQGTTIVDVFGEIGVDGTGEPWEHTDGWAYRNNGTGADGSTFVLANWSFSGIDALDGATSNATAGTPFPLGTYNP